MILDGYFDPLVFWYQWEYLRSPAKNLSFFAGYLSDWQWFAIKHGHRMPSRNSWFSQLENAGSLQSDDRCPSFIQGNSGTGVKVGYTHLSGTVGWTMSGCFCCLLCSNFHALLSRDRIDVVVLYWLLILYKLYKWCHVSFCTFPCIIYHHLSLKSSSIIFQHLFLSSSCIIYHHLSSSSICFCLTSPPT